MAKGAQKRSKNRAAALEAKSAATAAVAEAANVEAESTAKRSKKSKKSSSKKTKTISTKNNNEKKNKVDEEIEKKMNELVEESDSEDDSGDDSEDDSEDDAEMTAEHKKRMEVDAKTQKIMERKIEALKKRKLEQAKKGVIYLGNIPFGFFEKEMKIFFGQFGEVSRIRLSRSKKTGNYRGFGFIEFEHLEVAEIAAETMDHYLMYGRLLKVKVVPAEKVHPYTFKNAGRPFRQINWSAVEDERRSQPKSEEKIARLKAKMLKKEREHREQLKSLGIDYDYPGYAKAFEVEKKSSKKSKKKSVGGTEAKKVEAKEEKAVVAKPTPKSTPKTQPKTSKKTEKHATIVDDATPKMSAQKHKKAKSAQKRPATPANFGNKKSKSVTSSASKKKSK